MWRLGFFFHEIAFGMLSVFIPLFVVTPVIGGSIVDIGIMTSIAALCSIPASFFWGYICDKTRRYKIYVLLAFLSITVILFALTFVKDIFIFIVLYVLMAVLHVAHESPKNVLIAEHYSRNEWEKSFSFYKMLTEAGFLVGLLLGLFAFATTMSFGALANYILYLCSGLNLAAFILSVLLISDPIMIFERRLVGLERKLDYTFRGIAAAHKIMDGHSFSLKKQNVSAFALGMVLFSLASSLFFTPLPIFFKECLSLQTNMIYAIYMSGSVGSIIGYLIMGRIAARINGKKQIERIILLRGLLVFLLILAVQFAVAPSIVSGGVLIIMGFAYAIYYVVMLSLSMELFSNGKNGLFEVFIGLGGAIGSFFGPFLASVLGYLPLFAIVVIIFFVAFAAIKKVS